MKCSFKTKTNKACKNSAYRKKGGTSCYIHDPDLQLSCAVCLVENHKRFFTNLPCGHSFHIHCINKLKQKSQNKCPLCRFVFFETPDEQVSRVMDSHENIYSLLSELSHINYSNQITL